MSSKAQASAWLRGTITRLNIDENSCECFVDGEDGVIHSWMHITPSAASIWAGLMQQCQERPAPVRLAKIDMPGVMSLRVVFVDDMPTIVSTHSIEYADNFREVYQALLNNGDVASPVAGPAAGQPPLAH